MVGRDAILAVVAQCVRCGRFSEPDFGWPPALCGIDGIVDANSSCVPQSLNNREFVNASEGLPQKNDAMSIPLLVYFDDTRRAADLYGITSS